MKNYPYYESRHIENIKDMLNQSANLFKNKVAYYVENENGYDTITFSQLKSLVDCLGTALYDLELKNKNIVVIGENRYEWSIAYLATITGNDTVIPLDRQLPTNELEKCLKRVKVDAIIFSSKLKDTILEINKEVNVPILIDMDLEKDKDGILSFQGLIEKGETLIKSGINEFINCEIDKEKCSAMLFTSGTSAESKIVMLSHKNIAFNIENQCKMILIEPTDRFLSVLPLHHAYECTCGFLTPIYRGASVTHCSNLRNIQKYLKEQKITVMLTVPAILEFMYRKIWDGIEKQGKSKLVKKMIKITNTLDKCGIHIKRKVFKQILEQLGGNIKLFIAGAAKINSEVAQGYRDIGILAIQGYGLSECAPIGAVNRDVMYNDDAAGLPLINTQVKIVDKNDEGIGEIVIKGNHVMLGYYDNPEATAETIKDGWLYTGDLGYMDENNFVYITGRKKNVIVLDNGKNVYPEEIEVLLNNTKYIKESMVYGKKIDNSIVLNAQLVLDKDALDLDYPNKSDEDIKNTIWEDVKKVNQQLVIYKYIKNIEIRDKDFEKTTTLKIKRYKEIV